jgi:beta-alanine degradation protein BauB
MHALVEHVLLEEATFDPAPYAEEIAAAPGNFEVASAVWFENADVRIWDFLLEPGYRHPFHCHRTTYYWICTAAGRGIQRLPDGTLTVWQFNVGEVDFLQASPDAPLIHDLENVGDTPLRFSTVELLRGTPGTP